MGVSVGGWVWLVVVYKDSVHMYENHEPVEYYLQLHSNATQSISRGNRGNTTANIS